MTTENCCRCLAAASHPISTTTTLSPTPSTSKMVWLTNLLPGSTPTTTPTSASPNTRPADNPAATTVLESTEEPLSCNNHSFFIPKTAMEGNSSCLGPQSQSHQWPPHTNANPLETPQQPPESSALAATTSKTAINETDVAESLSSTINHPSSSPSLSPTSSQSPSPTLSPLPAPVSPLDKPGKFTLKSMFNDNPPFLPLHSLVHPQDSLVLNDGASDTIPASSPQNSPETKPSFITSLHNTIHKSLQSAAHPSTVSPSDLVGPPIDTNRTDALCSLSSTLKGPISPATSDEENASPTFYHDHDEDTSSMPLSLKMLHRPSRALEQLEKASDPTKRNSLFNSHLRDFSFRRNNETKEESSAIATTDSSNSLNSLPSETGSNLKGNSYKLVRKKSGEILKPSLKEHFAENYKSRRSLSLPTTPTYKQVHFGSDNNVKYFKKRDKPLTISATNSPNLESQSDYFGQYDDDDDDVNESNDDGDSTLSDPDEDFTSDDEDLHNFNLNHGSTKYPYPKREKLIDWKVKLLNFAPLSYLKKIHDRNPVFLERIFITNDKKYLVGHIAVKNIAFEKRLTVRYSLDGWLTVIEIPTSYEKDRPDVLKSHDYDRFTFKIPLENLFNSFRLENNLDSSNQSDELNKENTYELCIKYNTDNNEFWDNNNFKNYGIKLIKLIKNINQAAVNRNLPNKLTSENSTIQDHFEKPKYSNNFLRRRVSDSEIEKKRIEDKDDVIGTDKTPEQSAEKTTEEAKEKTTNIVQDKPGLYNTSNASSDFDKNNFYLSSPLFSLYKNNKVEPNSFEKISPIIKQEPSNEVDKKGDEKGKNKENDQDSAAENGPKQSSSNIIGNIPKLVDSKSYKELLDNYCFFTSPKPVKENQKQETSLEDQKPADSDSKVYAVSSFLGTQS